MSRVAMLAFAALCLGATAVRPAAAQDGSSVGSHAVFAMTNNAYRNEVVAYQRLDDGTLTEKGRFATGGRGSGGSIDPLSSQGSLTLAGSGAHLLAVNAGSGTVSVFGVRGAYLWLEDVQPTFGVEPAAIAEHGDLVYVANFAAASSVIGFRFQENGRLRPIPNSQRFLSGTSVGTGGIAISPDGEFLAVAERTTNNIDVFKIESDGTLGPIVINKDPLPGVFAIVFSADGALLVSETGAPGATNGSTVSSFFIAADGTLAPVTIGVPTLGAAACWLEVSPNEKWVYVGNSGSSNLSGFLVGAGGALTPFQTVITGQNPAGSVNLDFAISSDGKFLFTLNGATGNISTFAIGNNGNLTLWKQTGGLPAAGGLNGIAAN